MIPAIVEPGSHFNEENSEVARYFFGLPAGEPMAGAGA